MKRITLFVSILLTLSAMNDIQAQSTKVKMKTTLGDITILLYDDTPIHKDNFIDLVNKKFYEGVLFHRVIPSFMVQAGDPASKTAKAGDRLGASDPKATIPAEFKQNHWHKRGALAAARMGDQVNPTRASSQYQFYIVTGRSWSMADLSRMEQDGSHPKFTDEQKQVYTSAGGYPPLDYQYTVFGEVTEGMDVVEKISKVQRNQADRPIEDIKILSVTLVK